MDLVSKMFVLVNKTKEANFIFFWNDYHYKKISVILEAKKQKNTFTWQYVEYKEMCRI